MPLNKTTILPTDDDELATRILKELIHEEPKVLLLVLGAGKASEQFATRADKLAGAEKEPRWVVWIRNPDAVQDTLDALSVNGKLEKKLKNAHGLALSLVDEICDVIEDANPSLVRILAAYLRAETK